MARGVNKVILVGNLGNDPEIRYTQNGGTPIANLSIATSEGWKDKQSGEMVEQTEWHRVVCFARLAEICGEYLRKGSKVYIEGRIRTRKWQDQSGNDRYTTEIIANEMQMLDSRSGGGGGQYTPKSQPNMAQNDFQAGGGAEPAPSAPVTEDFDDDIPF